MYNFDWEIIEKCRKKKYSRCTSRKEYQHEYYLQVTKLKRQAKRDATDCTHLL